MPSSAHQFCCQIIYHPRKRCGFGWFNGEGNERIWALSKDTIGSERLMRVCEVFNIL
jgi:Kyakuja-Dileera-Zisupton transposase